MTYNGESLSSREISCHKLASFRFAEKYRFWHYGDEFWWRFIGNTLIFQQNNAAIHRSKKTVGFLLS